MSVGNCDGDRGTLVSRERWLRKAGEIFTKFEAVAGRTRDDVKVGMHYVLARSGPIRHMQVGALNFRAENIPERPIHALSNYRHFDELIAGQRGEVRSMTLGNDEHVTPVDRVTIP